MKRIAAFLATRLASEHLPYWAFLLGLLLTIPALSSGLMLDDYPHQLSLWPELQFPGGPRGDWDLFRFQGADRAYFQHQQELGLWPWWTTPNLRLAFFRPLASLHHALDYRMWPGAPWFMHLESMVIYALMAFSIAKLYQQILSVTVAAGLGCVLFAIDDAHSMVVMWIANRNALWAVLFGVLAVLCFVRYRAGTFAKGVVLGPLCFGLGLLSGETALGAAAYLFAYVVWREPGPIVPRLRLLLPYVLIGAVWAAAYGLMGYGSAGSGMYVDPMREPLTYLATVVIRMPLLLLAQLGLPPADLWMQVSAEVLPKAALIAWAVLGVGAVIGYRLLKGNRTAAFWATGMVLSLLPVCSVMPGDRLLLFSGVGAFGLLGMLAVRLWEIRTSPSALRRLLCKLGLGAIVLVHVVLAGLLLPYRISFLSKTFGQLVPRAAQSLPPSELFPSRTLVMVNAPDPLVATYAVAYRYLADHKMGDSIRLLSAVLRGTLLVTRVDDYALILEPSEGFIQEPLSRVFRSPALPMQVGEQVKLHNMTATVLAVTPQGVPIRVEFRFIRALEDASYIWTIWKDRGFVRFELPQVGQRVTLPAIDYQVAIGAKPAP